MIKLFKYPDRNGEKGFGMIEAMIAIALLEVIAVSFYPALATVYKSNFISEKRGVSLNVAQKQMEYIVKWQKTYAASYDVAIVSKDEGTGAVTILKDADGQFLLPTKDENDVDLDIDKVYGPYCPVNIQVTYVNPDGSTQAITDTGLQKITITINHTSESGLITLEGYKTKVS